MASPQVLCYHKHAVGPPVTHGGRELIRRGRTGDGEGDVEELMKTKGAGAKHNLSPLKTFATLNEHAAAGVGVEAVGDDLLTTPRLATSALTVLSKRYVVRSTRLPRI